MQHSSRSQTQAQNQALKCITNDSAKVSRVRYGAMRSLQLPYHRKMKQTTLDGFAKAAKKTSQDHATVTTRTLTREDKSLKLIKNDISTAEVTCLVKCNKLQEFDSSFSKSKPLLSSSVETNCDESYQASCIASANCNFISDPEIVDRSFDTGNKENYSQNLPIPGFSAGLNDWDVDSLLLQQMIESDQTLSQHVEDSCQIDYDLTMKFVTDSQGNKLFDRFTQKIETASDCLFSDSEQHVYKNFENDLVRKKFLQSTQKF